MFYFNLTVLVGLTNGKKNSTKNEKIKSKNNVSEKIKIVYNLYKRLPSIVFIIYMIMIYLYFTSLGLIIELNNANSTVLLVDYKDFLYIPLNIVQLILFLPTFIFVIMKLTSIPHLIISLLLTIPFWFFLSVLISFLYCRMRKIPFTEENILDKNKKFKSTIDFLIYVICINLFFFSISCILLYSKINIKISFVDFIKITSFMIVSVGFISQYIKEEKLDDVFKKRARDMMIALVFLMLSGSMLTLLTEIKVQDKLSKGILSGCQIGVLNTGLIIVLTILLLPMLQQDLEKKK